MKVKIPWGDDGILEIGLPGGWNYGGELNAKEFAPAPNVFNIQEALRKPINRTPLTHQNLAGKKVAIVVDDITRPTPVKVLFPEVMKELRQGGMAEENLKIIFALGNHRPMTPLEMQDRLGCRI